MATYDGIGLDATELSAELGLEMTGIKPLECASASAAGFSKTSHIFYIKDRYMTFMIVVLFFFYEYKMIVFDTFIFHPALVQVAVQFCIFLQHGHLYRGHLLDCLFSEE
jgi:hypothetical protein